MDQLWLAIVQWLHTVGLHVDAGAARSVAEGAARATAQLDMPSLLALAAALGWASGFRLYAVVFLVGMMGVLGWMPLPPGLAMLQQLQAGGQRHPAHGARQAGEEHHCIQPQPTGPAQRGGQRQQVGGGQGVDVHGWPTSRR